MFKKVLIANRGEIACRVITTLKKMGISSVAIYSDSDRQARHVKLADEAYYIGGSKPADSYLKSEAILALAKDIGVDAIHPGYGFLSENSGFAQACAASNICFIGPSSQSIEKMGAKDAAKKLMEAAGVPVVPGYHGDNQQPAYLQQQANAIGFPLLIKAVSGGGGKGMRVVLVADDFISHLEAVKREALNAFADERVLLERYIERPRHIEFQIFGDTHQHYIHLHERECSLQRRHQKIIEETPSPFLDDATRLAMGEAAVNAARAIDYQGAGTVEFIVANDRSFFFMEMNTRLQVEHPITEMVTGQDLVEWQLLVAAGEPLPLTQEQVKSVGHAFEARLYAENPNNQFLPSTGLLHRLRFPVESQHTRVESGVEQGDHISVFYDPMIAKLVTWGEDREVARLRLINVLSETGIMGVDNNINFLETLCSHDDFINNKIDTQYIDTQLDQLLKTNEADTPNDVLMAACIQLIIAGKQAVAIKAAASKAQNSPWFDTKGWRLNGRSERRFFFTDSHQKTSDIRVTDHGQHFVFHLDQDIEVHLEEHDRDVLRLHIGGCWQRIICLKHGNKLLISYRKKWYSISEYNPFEPNLSDIKGESTIVAPMPGKLLAMLVKNGDHVKKGQALATLEAMKMEHTLQAPFDTVVDQVFYQCDDFVEADATLITFVQPTDT